MENHDPKVAEILDSMLNDNQACSSVEFKPSSSNSSIQTHIASTNSHPETRDHDVETSSSASASSRSDIDTEKDSYGSCDSDDAEQRQNHYKNYQSRSWAGDHGRMRRIVMQLSDETDPSGQLALLTELCEVLSFCTDNSLSSATSELSAQLLVKLANHDDNPDLMLFAIRAITYLCDVHPQSTEFLVQHQAVEVLCQRLMAIEYLDVAEQCLQALDKISREQPLVCLHGGATMAVLNYIDFFSTSAQRVALSTVANICKKLPPECPSFMEAIPLLCNLLQYEDEQIVEDVAVCIIKISKRVSKSSAILEEFCRHGLIHHVTRLLNLNNRSTLSPPVYTDLIRLLAELSSRSMFSFATLYELNISNVLKDMLSTFIRSQGVYSLHAVDGQYNQACELLKFLHELLPTFLGGENVQLASEKESYLVNHPDVLQNFGRDILPLMIQVVNSGASTSVCYGCLIVVYNLVYLSKSEVLAILLKDAKIASFLARAFTRKDHHVLILSLKIADMLLQKLPDIFMNSFIKEGVFFAIKVLLSSEKGLALKEAIPAHESSHFENTRCLCYTFSVNQSSSSVTETLCCRLKNNSVCDLAEKIRSNYFASDIYDLGGGVTDILQMLQTSSVALDELSNNLSNQNEDKVHHILLELVSKLKGCEFISTFEFIESGIVKALMNCLSNGQYMMKNQRQNDVYGHYLVVEKRFEVFAKLFLSYSDPTSGELLLSLLLRKLQNILSSLEKFPVVLNQCQGFKQRNCFAAVPNGRRISYPCLRVRFVKGDGELYLCDYSEDVLTVDPLSSLDAIIEFLWPKVSTKRTKHIRSSSTSEARDQTENQPIQLSPMEDEKNLPRSPSDEPVSLTPSSTSERTHLDISPESNNSLQSEHPSACSNDDTSPRLLLYLDGQQLDSSLTFYQAILKQKINEDEIFNGTKLLDQVYTLTYRRDQDSRDICSPACCPVSVPESNSAYMQCASTFSNIFDSDLTSDLEKHSPTYDVLFLLKSLEGMNRLTFHLLSHQRIHAFAEGRSDSFDDMEISVPSASQNEFISSKLTEKLEQQMSNSLAMSTGGMPSWCNQLMVSCPFLFSFEARRKYFHLSAFGPLQVLSHTRSNSSPGNPSDRRMSAGSFPRKKVLVSRNQVLDSASEMMEKHVQHKVLLEVEFNDEVGSGLGPTLEFYTLICREFQKSGLGMWREDLSLFSPRQRLVAEDDEISRFPFGLFPRPWASNLNPTLGLEFSEVTKKFVLLGQVVARSIQDGRVLDLCFSKAFYKLILGQEINLFDIQSFDPDLGWTLLEFQALVERKKFLESSCGEKLSNMDLSYRNTNMEDLCIDFTLPGYPEYILTSGPDHAWVNMDTLEDYISLTVDATINTGIARQVEAFKSGFNKIFPIEHLRAFTTDELERLLCGEQDSWAQSIDLLDHIKFDHGYTASSPPINNLLEIIREFDNEQQRLFLQFVTGAPRLPPGGLGSLNPKLTIVRKHSSNLADSDLPSVMTCANYLKLPPYSSKERMKEKILYAIKEGQGSFHLS